jgi:Na+-driven multidrug efflux pump
MYITILGQWIIKIPVAFFLAKYTILGPDGIWWSEPITSIIICVLMFFVMLRVDWSKSNLTKQDKIEKKVIEETIVEEPVRDF